ncbi:MAG: type III-B CRISPR module RAMP protein Cmr6 [Fimbriimonadales bacterium]|nr:MAG: hypothetical protein KatS3mg018_1030 [Fimbriimonadales bacterium]
MESGVPARRDALKSLKPESHTHAGLLLQRYLTAHKPKQRDNSAQTPEEQLLERALGVQASECYRAAFTRWQGFAQQSPAWGVRVHFTVKAVAPIAIGLGAASPLEVGLRLHHTYGMPLLPGSALKGLCRRVARRLHNDKKLSDAAIDALFGFSRDRDAAAGAVVFYDAWYDPASVEGKPFHRDVITVHHPAYYGGGTAAPTDFDDPTPVPFIVIKPGARFLCVLDAPDHGWAEFARKTLLWGLGNLGVGAKTNAGYGYLTVVENICSAQTALEANEKVWEQAQVIYEPGPRRVKAVKSPSEQAFVEGNQAAKILEEMPDELREQLKVKKRITADVLVEQLGNQRTLKRIL